MGSCACAHFLPKAIRRYLLLFLLILTEISYFFHITIKHESYLNGNQYWNFGEKKKKDMAKYTYRLFNERTLYHRYQNRVEIEVEKQFTL